LGDKFFNKKYIVILNMILYNLLKISSFIIFFIFLFFIYIFNKIDYSSITQYIKENNNRKTIVAFYGHTSFLDGIILIYLVRKSNFMSFANIKYKKWYPKIIHKYFYFIDGNKNNKNSKKKYDYNKLAISIEGTRGKNNYLRSGYKYIAQNNNYDIVYAIINYKTLKLELSNKIEYDKIPKLTNDDLLEPLKQLIKNKIYAIFLLSCSDIQFKN